MLPTQKAPDAARANSAEIPLSITIDGSAVRIRDKQGIFEDGSQDYAY